MVAIMISRKLHTCVQIFLLFIFVSFSIPCNAASSDFTFSPVLPEEGCEIWSRCDPQSVNTPAPETGFYCYAVSQTGEIALGFNLPERDMVLVYSSDTEYLYGFTFKQRGDFGLEWDGDTVIVYTEEYAFWIARDNSCLSVKKIEDNADNHIHWQNLRSPYRTHNLDTYTAEHWLGESELFHWAAYPRLVKVNAAGETTVLLDYSGVMLSKLAVIAIPILLFAGLTIAVSVLLIWRLRKSSFSTKK